MKNVPLLVLLLSSLFLYACGSGSTTTSSNDGNSSSNPGEGSSNTTFTLKLVDNDKVASKASVFGSLPVATDVRVVIRRSEMVTTTHVEYLYTYDTEGYPVVIPGSGYNVSVTSLTEVYKDIQDVPYDAGGTVQIGIPQGTGYTIDVITSRLESGNHSILKYGQASNVDVVAGQTNSATITINPLSSIFNMTVADEVVSKGKFNVTLNNGLPIAPNYKMTMSFGANPPTIVSNLTNTCTFTAPESYTAGTIYLQGEFTLNKAFLSRTETPAQWTRLFPSSNAAYNEQVYSNLSPLIAVSIPVL